MSLLRDHGTFMGGIVHREFTAHDVVSVTACESFAREVISAYVCPWYVLQSAKAFEVLWRGYLPHAF